ncbi:All-trans-retinol 13,14-reductase (fragment) [Planktothrix sp. PCC 11201]|uniref:phytoene desaturase family protein n=1 Tax=Planktothrix sp. PCC 11201 TaxID=1729650 RepID=UPI0009214F22
MQSFDGIVIGSGIGGLVAGGLLAHSGKQVLILEGHSLPGGAAQGFSRQGFHFDSGPSFYCGLSDSQGLNPLSQVLTRFYPQKKQEKAEPLYRALEKVIPNLRQRITLELIGTPLTHARFLRRYQGTYGPAIRAGKGRFPGLFTPIQGLYLVGDSTQPGIGVPAVASSGILCANCL